MRIAAIAAGLSRPRRLSAASAAMFLALSACSSAPRSAGDSVSANASPAASGVSAASAAPATGTAAVSAEPTLVVYKTPTCGCCKGWVKAMETAGFKVEVHDLDDLASIKHAAGVPDELQACHTARIGGYVVEGHVPPADVRRLLAERPNVAGIATPGMPMGSPGMEGGSKDHYDVVTFGGDGRSTVFASH